MDTAGGRGARARRGTRPAAPRSRGAEKGAARSPERDRVAGESLSGAATPRAPRTDAPPARGSRTARRAPAAREQPATSAEAFLAPRSRAASGAEGNSAVAILAPRSRAASGAQGSSAEVFLAPRSGAASGAEGSSAEAFLVPRSRAASGAQGSSAEAFLAPRSRAASSAEGSGAEALLAPRSRAASGAEGSGAVAFLAPRSRAPAARAPAAPRSVAALPDGPVPASARRPPPAVDALRLREVLSRLSLAREDVSEASALVNLVVSHLVQAIRIKDSCFSSIERQSAGSYYERVKISEPNEFDIMLVMPITRIELEEADDTGAFYYVSFKRIPKEKGWLRFLEEDGKISAFKMLQALREIIKQEVKNIKDAEVTVARKKIGCPAITLQIKNPPSEISVDIILTLEAQQSWPISTQGGLKIEQWLGTKVRRNMRFRSIYLVAKQNKSEKVLRGNTWRLSFSHIEMDMIKNHGNSKTCCESDGPKCCRKGCLKLLKYLLEQLKMKYPKELEKFCSYHVKTAFFHSCITWPNDSEWCLGDLEHCFQQCLGFFVDCLQKSQLTHFFIPQYNLLSLEDKARHHFLSRKICHELNNGFPVFHENY